MMKVGLFIPCYINTVYPEVGVATYKLLKHFGLEVDYPVAQTCCGQPMANAGFEDKAVPLAQHFDRLFDGFDYVVAPSASCTAFVRTHYGRLLAGDQADMQQGHAKINHTDKSHAGKEHVCESAGKTLDICEFLHDVLQIDQLPGVFAHRVSIHNSCHGVRELHLSTASELNRPRDSKIKNLLSLVKGIELVEPEHVDECCGFGGMFAIEEGAVSAKMGRDKLPVQFIHATQIMASGL